MTMGQQRLQPTQFANVVGNMTTMLPSSNDTSNDLELVNPTNNKKEDNKE